MLPPPVSTMYNGDSLLVTLYSQALLSEATPGLQWFDMFDLGVSVSTIVTAMSSSDTSKRYVPKFQDQQLCPYKPLVSMLVQLYGNRCFIAKIVFIFLHLPFIDLQVPVTLQVPVRHTGLPCDMLCT